MSNTSFSPESQSLQGVVTDISAEEPASPAPASQNQPTPMQAILIVILGGLNVLGPLSVDTYLPALPTVSHDLGATTSQTQITLSAAILGLALGSVFAGPISDAIGRRRPLLIGMAVYALTALLCVFAPSVGVLTALRFVQGAAAAAGISISLAVARDLYTSIALARTLSLLMMIQAIGPIIAPTLGSLLLTFTSWHGIFVALALVGVALVLLTALGLKETLPAENRTDGSIAASLSAFRDLLTDRRFIGYALSSGFAFTTGIVYISDAPFILQNLYGVSPQVLGILFGVNGLGIIIVSQINRRLVGRIAPQRLLAVGLSTIALGGLAMLAVALSGAGLVGLTLAFLAIAASLGLIIPNAAALALSHVRAAGSAAALLGLLQLAIGALTAPVVGLGGSSSAVPMAATIAAFGLATLLTFLALCRPAQAQAQPQPGD